mmetsp:Transcript_39885/g.127539  ORF Transcript_39885/g.127539 Transcript_39885/m.127539 type:complete len:265 (+) Transcript_39885:2430-3224(+)
MSRMDMYAWSPVRHALPDTPLVRSHAITVIGLYPADVKGPVNTTPPSSAIRTRSFSDPFTPASAGGTSDREAFVMAPAPEPPFMTSAKPSAPPKRWVGRSVLAKSSIDWKPLYCSRRSDPPAHTEVTTTRADVTPSTGPKSNTCARPEPESSKSKDCPSGCKVRRTPRTRASGETRSRRAILQTPSAAAVKELRAPRPGFAAEGRGAPTVEYPAMPSSIHAPTPGPAATHDAPPSDASPWRDGCHGPEEGAHPAGTPLTALPHP